MNAKAKTQAKTAETQAADAVTTAADAGAAEQAQSVEQAAPAPAVAAKPQPITAEIGPDFTKNGEAVEALIARGFPLSVTVSNQMPRRVTFPELQGLLLAHVAGLPELTTQPATFRNADQLHRFATDVQALCELNGFEAGVVVQTV